MSPQASLDSGSSSCLQNHHHQQQGNNNNQENKQCNCGKCNNNNNNDKNINRIKKELNTSCCCGCKCGNVMESIVVNKISDSTNEVVQQVVTIAEEKKEEVKVSDSNQQVVQTIVVDENRPKPIPAPPMNDKCREYCKKVLHNLLEEYELLNNEVQSEEELKSCCHNESVPTNLYSKWPKYLTICGIGSLLSEKSARRTFPNLINFRKAIVKNYVRCFNLVAISSLNFGDLEKKKIASVAAVHQSDLEEETIRKIIRLQNQNDENKQEIEMYCSVFEIPLTEEIWCAYMTREHRYEFRFVTIDQDFQNGVMKSTCSCCENNCQCSELSSCGCQALMCCQFNDDWYKIERCSSYENEYYERVAQHFEGRLWYNTKHVQHEKHLHNNEIPIKPIPKYLELCFNAALEMGRQVFENFLQTSVMADGVTLLEDYLKVEEPELYQKFIGNDQQDL